MNMSTRAEIFHYNIPRKIRELQSSGVFLDSLQIITYQEKLGNYNLHDKDVKEDGIITYQEKLGNYNDKRGNEIFEKL